MKKITKIALLAMLAFGLAACGNKNANVESSSVNQAKPEETTAQSSKEKSINVATSFAYPSLDTHKEYYGWYTSMYGITQTLFKIDENLNIVPLLAKEYKTEGSLTSIKLKDNIKFSNGNKLDADTVIKNIERVISENKRFAYMKDFKITLIDELNFSIDTNEVYPTLINDLASPEFGILDITNIKDFDTEPIGTGPFIIDKFIPDGDVSVKRNENYWEKDVKLEKANFIYLKDDEARLLAMQNGEVDAYIGPNAAALEIFSTDKNTYTITNTSSTRLNFYILNEDRLEDKLRLAINTAIDKENIKTFLGDNYSVTSSPFSQNSKYGEAKDIEFNLEGAKKILEEAGYVKNSSDIYEKYGKALNINIAYYNARGLDTIATLMHEQLLKAGIDSTLKAYEDPDSTYITSRDFDIALYSMIADKVGDPYYFISSSLKDGGYFDIGGFNSEEANKLIDELKVETDTQKRATLANKIIQIAIDDNAYNYLTLFNKITVTRKGISGYSENSPFDFYGLTADTDIN